MVSFPARDAPRFVVELTVHGDRPALVGPEGTLTYRQLDARVDHFVERLGPGRRLVLIAATNSVEAIVAYLAALRSGHVAVLAAASDRHGQRRLVEVYDPDVTVDGGVHERRRGSIHDLHPELAMLGSTSGSTGTPKLVRLSPRNIDSNAAAIANYLALGPEDRAVTTLPMQYCYGLSVITSHLHVGASVVLSDLSVVDQCFWRLFSETGATSLAGVPHTFELLDRVGFDRMRLPTLRYLTQAGGRMAPERVRHYAELGQRDGWELFVMYGQTEATARMAFLPPSVAAARPEAVGVAIPGGTFEIASPDQRGVGEIVYRGPNVMLGYAIGPADLAEGRAVNELATGDLGRIAPDGLLEIVGRRSRVIKPFGVRVDLDDLERELAARNLPAVCCGDDNGLVTAIAPTVDQVQVQHVVDDLLHLPPNHRRVVQVAEIPRLANGKIDYDRICALRDLEPLEAAPDRSVRAAMGKVLDVEALDEDTFVSLGGDSLSYVEMSLVLEEVLGDVPRDWHLRTIGELDASRGRRAPNRWARLDASVVARAIGIILITGTHTGLWHLPGGAHALLGVAGFNFARFQLHGARRWTSIARVALPSMLWISLVAAVTDQFEWPHALMLNGIIGAPDSRWAYWFVEALLSILALVSVALAVPWVSRAQRAKPFVFACIAVGIGLMVRFDILFDLTIDHRLSRPHEVFWLFALGWAAAEARSNLHRAAVTVTVVAATIGFFHDTHRDLTVIAAIAVITWIGTVPIPRRLARAASAVAGASLGIYLTQFQLYPSLTDALGPAGATIGCVLAGIVFWHGASLLHRQSARTPRSTVGQTNSAAAAVVG